MYSPKRYPAPNLQRKDHHEWVATSAIGSPLLEPSLVSRLQRTWKEYDGKYWALVWRANWVDREHKEEEWWSTADTFLYFPAGTILLKVFTQGSIWGAWFNCDIQFPLSTRKLHTKHFTSLVAVCNRSHFCTNSKCTWNIISGPLWYLLQRKPIVNVILTLSLLAVPRPSWYYDNF